VDLRLSRRWSALVSGFVLVTACIHAGPARAADPLLMFLLGWAKNIIESHMDAKGNAQKQPLPVSVFATPSASKPPAKVTESDLRSLVDDGFAYLSPSQRAELLAGLEKALGDPANSAHRDDILVQFANVARQAGYTHRQLDRLSTSEKRMLARQFAANYRSLTPEQQQELLQRLKLGALPLPSDLNEMMLAALAPTG